MFQYGALAEGLRIEHQHADGSWSPMDPEEAHDPTEHDPERDWQRGHVFVCDCGETVRLMAPGESAAGEPPGSA
jgi:hypothetical protein